VNDNNSNTINSNNKIDINCDKSGDIIGVNDLNAFLNINDINNDSNDCDDCLDYEYVKTSVNNKLIQYINDDSNDPKTESDFNRVKRPQTEAILNIRYDLVINILNVKLNCVLKALKIS